MKPGAGRRTGSRKGSRSRARKRWIGFAGLGAAAVVALAFAVNALAGGGPPGRGQPGSPPGGPAARLDGQSTAVPKAGAEKPGAVRAGSPAVTSLPKLTARQLAGQRVIYSYRGPTPPARLLWLISHGQAAGVIFFGSNIASRAQLKAVVWQLERANASKTNPVRAPLLLMTDQEGGEVRRLPGQPYLSEKQIGQSAHPEAEATAAGRGAGLNLRGVGINVNLAPVLDVYRHAGDFDDQYQRSYSKNPRVVSRLGTDFIKAQQKTGVAATAKHFPGLGAASRSQNTDLRPVTLRLSAATIRNVDEFPYRAAVYSARVKLVMASWAVYPALDRKYPAGLSSRIVQGELRKRLQFRGVTITDALEAGALKAFGTYAHRAELAASAGMDLILASGQSVAEGDQAASGLVAGYRNGTLGHTAFRASVLRILALRTGLPG